MMEILSIIIIVFIYLFILYFFKVNSGIIKNYKEL